MIRLSTAMAFSLGNCSSVASVDTGSLAPDWNGVQAGITGASVASGSSSSVPSVATNTFLSKVMQLVSVVQKFFKGQEIAVCVEVMV